MGTIRIHASKVEQFLKKQNEQKPRKKYNLKEDSIQKRCRAEFDRLFPQYRLLLNHFKNEQAGDRQRIRNYQMGVRSGAPDFIFLHPNKKYPFIAIEMKSEKGRQSKEQKIFQAAVEAARGKYVICRSVSEFIKEMKTYIAMI